MSNLEHRGSRNNHNSSSSPPALANGSSNSAAKLNAVTSIELNAKVDTDPISDYYFKIVSRDRQIPRTSTHGLSQVHQDRNLFTINPNPSNSDSMHQRKSNCDSPVASLDVSKCTEDAIVSESIYQKGTKKFKSIILKLIVGILNWILRLGLGDSYKVESKFPETNEKPLLPEDGTKDLEAAELRYQTLQMEMEKVKKELEFSKDSCAAVKKQLEKSDSAAKASEERIQKNEVESIINDCETQAAELKYLKDEIEERNWRINILEGDISYLAASAVKQLEEHEKKYEVLQKEFHLQLQIEREQKSNLQSHLMRYMEIEKSQKIKLTILQGILRDMKKKVEEKDKQLQERNGIILQMMNPELRILPLNKSEDANVNNEIQEESKYECETNGTQKKENQTKARKLRRLKSSKPKVPNVGEMTNKQSNLPAVPPLMSIVFPELPPPHFFPK